MRIDTPAQFCEESSARASILNRRSREKSYNVARLRLGKMTSDQLDRGPTTISMSVIVQSRHSMLIRTWQLRLRSLPCATDPRFRVSVSRRRWRLGVHSNVPQAVQIVLHSKKTYEKRERSNFLGRILLHHDTLSFWR